MASEGPNGSTSAANDTDAGTSWSLLTNIAAEDATGILCGLAAGADSKTVKLTIAGFSIPAAAVIDGIVAEVKWNSSTDASSVRDTSVKTVINGTTSPNNKAIGSYFPTTFTYSSYGSTTDKWGYTGLVGSDVNTSFILACKVHNDAAGSRNGRIDFARVTVYYTSGFDDQGTVTVLLVPSASEAGPYADAATESFKFGVSATENAQRVDSGTELFALSPQTIAEGKQWADAATENFALIVTGTEQRVSTDLDTEYLKFTISTQGADFATIPMNLTPNGTDTYLSGFRPERRQRGQG